MRVAILGQFPLDLTRLGGVEVAIVYLLGGLRQEGVDDIHVITCHTGIQRERTVSLTNATAHYLPRRDRGRLTWHVREVRHMRSVLRALRPDIVHAHGTGLYAGAVLGSGFPNVITVHGIVAREAALYKGAGLRLRGLVDVAYERWCLRRAQDVIAISPYVSDVLRPLTKARFHLVENAVDSAFFAVERKPEPRRILFVGPVIERKGLVPLFRALAKVKSTMPDVSLRVAGGTAAEPHYYRALADLAQEMQIVANLHFLGHLEQQQLLEEYARCTCMVLPSFQETAPMAVQQAMAAGVPVVATPVGGVPHLVEDGCNGLLVPVGASAELASALTRLLNDPDLCVQLGGRSRERAQERLRPDVVAHRTKAVYDDILSRAGRP